MARLANKGFVARAPQTSGAVPELPDFSPQLAELPGGTETNAALQRWWDLVSQRIEFTNASDQKQFFSLKTQFTDGDTTLAAAIEEERVVRADADTALAFDILTVSAEVDGLTASVAVIASALATAEGYLESRWTVNVTAGPIVTGMTLFSASGPDTEVSYVAFQADRFQINTSTGGNKLIFSGTGSAVKLGDVLTVDLANTKVFIGVGTYGNANTPWYVDTSGGGRMSLGSKFTWDGATLTIDGNGTFSGTITASAGAIGGWTIGATTLSGGNATLSSTGFLLLGTSNDVVILSSADSTYRLWVGNVTAGSAAFSVTKAGVLFASGATITGNTTLISTNRILATDNGAYTTWQGDSAINIPGFYAQHETNAGGGFASVGVGTNAPSAIFLSRSRGSFGALTTITTDDVIGAIGFTAYNGATWNTYGVIRSGISNSTSTPFLYMEADTALTLVVTTGKLFFSAAGGPLNAFGAPSYMSDQTANLYRSAAGTMKTDGHFVVGGNLSVTGNVLTATRALDGTAGAPAYSFSSDTDSGIYLSAAGTINFSTSSAARMTVRDTAVVMLVDLKLNTTRVPGVPVPGGTIDILDASGSTVSLITT